MALVVGGVAMPVLRYEEDSDIRVPVTAAGIGLAAAIGAVLLELLDSNGTSIASIVISLIVCSTVIIVAGMITFGLLSRTGAANRASPRAATDQLHGSPFVLTLPRNWDPQSVEATLRNDTSSEVYKVVDFRPQASGDTEALLEGPHGLTWHKLEMLSSVRIRISPNGDERKQLSK